MSSLTHTLTHTGKSPYGISETRSTRKDVEGERDEDTPSSPFEGFGHPS